jgi:DNA-binding beta-propeller fold protein YncE
MNARAALGFGLLAVLAACAARRGADDPGRALLAVVSKGLPGVTIYDAANDRQVCQVKMDVAPHEAAFSPGGRMLYVPIYSSANIGQPGPDGHTINFVDTSNCRIEYALDTGTIKRPHYPEVGPDGMLYVTAEQQQAILVVDPRRRVAVGTIPTGSANTHFFAISPDGSKLFTSNVSDRTLSVLDVPGRRLLATVDAGASNQRMAVSPDGRWFVTSLWQSGKVAFYRTADHQLDFTMDIEGAPFVARFSADGRYLYSMGNAPAGAQPAGIRVWKIDTAFKHVTAHSTDVLGTGTGSIQVNPLNGQVYLTAYSGQVSVLDPDDLKLLRQFTAPDTPDGLFFGRLQ